MGLLGDFLESFYGSGQTFQSVRGKLRQKCRPATQGETSRRRPIGKQKAPSAAHITTVNSEFWAVLPDKVRVDSARTKNGKIESTVEITRGGESLKRTPDGTVEVEKVRSRRRAQEGGSLPTNYRRHFDRSLIREFFASLVLEDAGACQVAGRDCVRIRAVPVPGDSIWPHWLPSEADEFEFAADLGFPSLLTITGFLSGQTIEHIEVVDIAFDEQIDESTFVCQPLAGQSTRSTEPVTQRVTLETAVAKVPFTVLLPKRGVGEGNPDLHYEPGKNERAGESVFVMYLGDGSNSVWFHLRAKPEPESDEGLEWEEVEVAGRQIEISDPEVEGGMICLRFCQDGTWIEVVSDHSRQDLFDIAMSFEPV
ncbi:hypothetical protein [Adhaeretor mobilis]|nr:hypothetical protein [Adhaeretor mobilis]